MNPTQKINQLKSLRMEGIAPELVMRSRGLSIAPTRELLEKFSSVLGYRVTLNRFNRLFSGSSEMSLAEATLFSWFYDIPIDTLCSLEPSAPRAIDDSKIANLEKLSA